MTKFKVIDTQPGGPPRPLGSAGQALWHSITRDYDISDAAGHDAGALWLHTQASPKSKDVRRQHKHGGSLQPSRVPCRAQQSRIVAASQQTPWKHTFRHFDQTSLLRIEGQLRTHIDRDEARRCFQAAIDAGRKASMKSLELRAALALHDFQLSQDEKVDIGGLFEFERPLSIYRPFRCQPPLPIGNHRW